MDILNLVDKLEELFSQGRSIPLTHNAIPDEIKRSQQVLAQRDRILAQAKEEHERIIERAKEEREGLISKNEIVNEANKRAEQITSQAKTEAEVIKREADKYALDTLKRLEYEMDRSINQIRNGIRTLERDQEIDSSESSGLAKNP